MSSVNSTDEGVAIKYATCGAVGHITDFARTFQAEFEKSVERRVALFAIPHFPSPRSSRP